MAFIFHNLLILGHLLIGLYFAFLGCWNIYHWVPILKVLAERGTPHPYFVLPVGIAIQIITGVMIMFGILIPIAALVLIPSTIVIICIFHPFWHFKGESRMLNFTIFISNLTVTLGALILLLIPQIV